MQVYVRILCIIELLYDPAITIQGIYPKGIKAGSQKDIRTRTFIAARFTVAKRWKQAKCPRMDDG